MIKTAKFKSYLFLWKILDWILPPKCAGCDADGAIICQTCRAKIEYLPSFAFVNNSELVYTNKDDSRFLDSKIKFLSYTTFSSPIREAILGLKYHQNLGLGIIFAEFLSDFLDEFASFTFDLITTVPLGKERKKERSYNQASIIAFPLAFKRNLPFDSKLITRIRETRSQVGLTKTERKINVAGAFSATIQAKGKSILIIDDVITTGSTMLACAKALIDHDAKNVVCLSVAKALYKKGSEAIKEHDV